MLHTIRHCTGKLKSPSLEYLCLRVAQNTGTFALGVPRCPASAPPMTHTRSRSSAVITQRFSVTTVAVRPWSAVLSGNNVLLHEVGSRARRLVASCWSGCLCTFRTCMNLRHWVRTVLFNFYKIDHRNDRILMNSIPVMNNFYVYSILWALAAKRLSRSPNAADLRRKTLKNSGSVQCC